MFAIGEFLDNQVAFLSLWRRYLEADRDGWFWGGRLDVWDLEIDWADDRRGGGQREGTSDVIVR